MGRGLFTVNKKFSALSNGKSRNTVNSQNHRHFSAQSSVCYLGYVLCMGVRITSPLTCVVITADKIEILKATMSIKNFGLQRLGSNRLLLGGEPAGALEYFNV